MNSNLCISQNVSQTRDSTRATRAKTLETSAHKKTVKHAASESSSNNQELQELASEYNSVDANRANRGRASLRAEINLWPAVEFHLDGGRSVQTEFRLHRGEETRSGRVG